METLDGDASVPSCSTSAVKDLNDLSISLSSPPSSPPLLVDLSDNPLLMDATSSSWLTFDEAKPAFSCSPENSLVWRSSEFRTSCGEFKPTMMGAGLENLGNTCFLNAILQCFTHTVPLVQGIRSWNHATQCDGGTKGFCVLCTLRDHIELSLASSGGVISPLSLVENLSNISSSFTRYQQEDAHEFLQCLLDRLDTCCLDPNTPTQSLSLQENSIVRQIFGGQLRSQLQCCNCGHCSDTFEPLIDLSLEIEDADSLTCALQSFTKVEKIDPETRFTCEKCKQQVSVEKQLTLHQAPSIAAFHLKRFKSDGSNVEKIDKHVAYPLELDLQPYTSSNHENNVELKYELYAVVVHVGFSPWSGHYFCYIRSSPHTWHRLDDSKVIRVEEEGVLSQNAYILFYARQGLPWFSTLMETQNKCVDASSGTISPKSVLDDVDRMCATVPLKASTSIVEDEGRLDAEGINSVWDMKVDEFGNDDQIDEARTDAPTPSTVSPTEASKCNDKVDEPRSDAQRTGITSTEASNCKQEVPKTRNDVSVPQTPPRSPSPDIYSEEPPELIYSIPRNHLRPKNTAKRTSGSKDLVDCKKEACKLTRSMPSSRRSQLLKAVLGSESEGSLNRKKRRRVLDSSNACGKLSPSSLISAVTSELF
ncbi:ubiquitin carboxyl-terminal hydrolase 21-like [Macadamia integrifolia]|uniref:ubiquitin carboxyl-terminal hydrolase 21-like n=1 Tax=Macadamia integrifolia TaxID=60698 RepID=UPI001C4E8558|nr:ubiquitin carboxyl-terminal hydrolase 21-like [Macadamia integrifolia]